MYNYLINQLFLVNKNKKLIDLLTCIIIVTYINLKSYTK